MTHLRLVAAKDPRRRPTTISEISLMEDGASVYKIVAEINRELFVALERRDPELLMRACRRLLGVGEIAGDMGRELELLITRAGSGV